MGFVLFFVTMSALYLCYEGVRDRAGPTLRTLLGAHAAPDPRLHGSPSCREGRGSEAGARSAGLLAGAVCPAFQRFGGVWVSMRPLALIWSIWGGVIGVTGVRGSDELLCGVSGRVWAGEYEVIGEGWAGD